MHSRNRHYLHGYMSLLNFLLFVLLYLVLQFIDKIAYNYFLLYNCPTLIVIYYYSATMGSDIKKQNEEIAYFILKVDGEIISCNEYAAALFKYSSIEQLEGTHLKELVPDDFAKLLPDLITQEHLTNGRFYQRVNVCADKTHINTLVKTQFVYIDSQLFVECQVKLNPGINPDALPVQCYKQTSELLLCEVVRLNKLLANNNEDDINFALKDKLIKVCDKLSHNDLVFCSLLLSGLSTKAIADKMFITDLSAFKLRKRIRRKLNLESDTDLYIFLSVIMHQ